MPTLMNAIGFEDLLDKLAGERAVTAPTGTFAYETANTAHGQGYSLKLTQNGATAACVHYSAKGFTRVGDTSTYVFSGYFRLTAQPSVDSAILIVTQDGVADHTLSFAIDTSGQVVAQFAAGGAAQTYATDICDSAWHRLDFSVDMSTTSFTADWAVDGNAQTQATVTGSAVKTINGFRFGSTDSADTATVWWDDVVLSETPGDYPLGEYTVKALYPDGDGTSNISGGGFKGNDNGTPTTTWAAYLDAPAGGTSPAATPAEYILQVNTAATEYVETTFDDTNGTDTIDMVMGCCWYRSQSTTANNGTLRIVDSGGNTLVNIVSGDLSENATNLYARIVPSVGGDGWTTSEVDGLKARSGFSSDAAPDPWFVAYILQIAVPVAAGLSETYGIAAETDVALAFTHSKLETYGLASETDAALAFIADRRHLYGIAAESDAALAFAHSKLAQYGLAAETDAALALVAAKLAQYGISLETDSGLPFTGTLGGGAQTAQYGIALETDAALAFLHAKLASYGIAAEVGTALAFLADRRHLYGVAGETDSGLAFVHSKLAPYGVAAETDAALALAVSKLVAYGIASETDTGLPFTGTLFAGTLAQYGVALETDEALAIVVSKLEQYGIAVEADTALAFIGTHQLPQTVLYEIAQEFNAALGFRAFRVKSYIEGVEFPMGSIHSPFLLKSARRRGRR